MVDYVKLAATAERLIRHNGRPITFVRKPGVQLDPTKPWKGADPTENEILLPLNGVFVTPNQVRIFGLSALGEGAEFIDMVSFSQQIIITFPGENDLRGYQTVRDGTINWNVTAYQFLRPANLNLLAFVGTRR